MDYLKYNFEELLKVLVILSLDADTQLKACGIGSAEDELAIDLDNYYTRNRAAFIKGGYLSEDVAKEIDDLNLYFDKRSGNDDHGFWSEIETHEGWRVVRERAKLILVKMGKPNLSVRIDVENDYGLVSGEIVSQQIKIELVD